MADIVVPQNLADRFAGLHERTRNLERQGIWLLGSPLFSINWVDFGAGYEPFAVRKTVDMVQFRGLIKRSAGTVVVNEQLFTLPVGYRPPVRTLQGVLNSGATLTYLDINTTGVVTFQGGSAASTSTWISLTQLAFSTTPSSTITF